jgi:hypothetical protein
MTIRSDSAMSDPDKLEYDADLDYSIADQLGIDVEDLEMCPKKVYDALLRYFDYHLSGRAITYRGPRNHN